MPAERGGFPDWLASVPALHLRDPLAEFLGVVGEGQAIEYSLADVAAMAGHLCPTVAGAWLVTGAALRALYGEAMPVRGDIEVTCLGEAGQFGYGPMAQVISNLTGAAGETGFHGLAGRFRRAGMLAFDAAEPALATFVFRRRDSGTAVRVRYSAEAVPADPRLRTVMAAALTGDREAGALFRHLWLDRVRRLLEAPPDVLTVEAISPAA